MQHELATWKDWKGKAPKTEFCVDQSEHQLKPAIIYLLFLFYSSGPQVFGHEPSYVPGQQININCSLPLTRPAANLTWFINNQKVKTNLTYKYYLVIIVFIEDKTFTYIIFHKFIV